MTIKASSGFLSLENIIAPLFEHAAAALQESLS
jgi:hypothetical protein